MNTINKKGLLYRLSFIVLLYGLSIQAQQPVQISIPFEVYDNAGGHITLYFGLDQTASDSIDIHLGESELPPYPPTGVFEARWFLPEDNYIGSLSSWYDYRYASGFPYSGTIEHRVRYQNTAGATIMYFSWNFPPGVTGLLQDLVNGSIVNVPLNGSGIFELTNFNSINPLKLLVYYNNIVTVIDDKKTKPSNYFLEQNYPNPFNPFTTIMFSLPEAAHTLLTIYNTLGQKIKELVNNYLETGRYNYQWDAKNVVSGVYIYELKTEKFVSIRKMILLR